jgi:tRNA threonylcarbamoyladenosine biosynthesis protein TsaE
LTTSPEAPLAFHSSSPAATAALGAALAPALEAPDLLCLEGDLGAGKTVFVHGVARGLGVREDVVSPTFVLQRIYRGRVPVYHFDFFRLDGGLDAGALGLGADQADGITIIEWSDRAPSLARWDPTVLRFEVVGDSSRRVRLLAGPERIRLAFRKAACS